MSCQSFLVTHLHVYSHQDKTSCIYKATSEVDCWALPQYICRASVLAPALQAPIRFSGDLPPFKFEFLAMSRRFAHR